MRALAEPIARLANKQDECTGRFWEGRFKAQRIVDEGGLLACAMYVDLNPVRAAMVTTPDQSLHTSAYDRIAGEKGQQIDSAAFDLVAISNEQAGAMIKQTPVRELQASRAARRRNPTSKRILRDGWLAPLTLEPGVLAADAQASASGLRASDKGFLGLALRDYLALLRWTAKQRVDGAAIQVPAKLRAILGRIGIDASMWRDLVWNFKKYFGRSSCAGSPQAMATNALQSGRRWRRGQRQVAACFAGS